MRGPFEERELDEEDEDEWRVRRNERKSILNYYSSVASALWNLKSEIMGRMINKGYTDEEIAEILNLDPEELNEMKRDLNRS